jgi:hypothetical protein
MSIVPPGRGPETILYMYMWYIVADKRETVRKSVSASK